MSDQLSGSENVELEVRSVAPERVVPEAIAGVLPQAALPAPEADHLVVTVHGIRTFTGSWQQRFEKILRKTQEEESSSSAEQNRLSVCHYSYGYFSAVALLVPVLRWMVARHFRHWLVNQVEANPNARIDLVAHSFGTYLVASSLRHLPKGRQINTLILAGSVLRPNFPWHESIGTKVKRLINECGTQDAILVLCNFIVLGLGDAGRRGFHGILSTQYMNRFYSFGHGGYFVTDDFMSQYWAPLVLEPRDAPAHDERQVLGFVGGAGQVLLNNLQLVKLVLLVGVLTLTAWHFKSTYEMKNSFDETTLFMHVGRLASSASMPQRSVTHVIKLLEEELPGHQLADFISPEGGIKATEDEPQHYWFVRLPWLYGSKELKFGAMRDHARGLAYFDAGNKATARDALKRALNSYERINKVPKGAHALCMLDTARVLIRSGQFDEAIELIDSLVARAPADPISMKIDALVERADANRWNGDWRNAEASLSQAEGLIQGVLASQPRAEGEKSTARQSSGASETMVNELEQNAEAQLLLAQVLMKRGWFFMDQWRIEEAEKHFREALGLLRANADQAGFGGLVWQYHIRHALAMIQRLEGNPVLAADSYDRLIEEINRLRESDDNLTSRQRWDLRERLVNSMERRVDCDLYVALNHLDFEIARPGQASSDEEKTDHSRRAMVALDQAVASIPITSQGITSPNSTRLPELFYKSCIARCLVSESDLTEAKNALAQAERMYLSLGSENLRNQLELTRTIARGAVAFLEARRAAAGGDEQLERSIRQSYRLARSELRQTLELQSANIASLKREQIEMLLLGCEFLLVRRMLPKEFKRLSPDELAELKADADFMNTVIGRATQLSRPHKLGKYIDRYRRISQHNARAAEDLITRQTNDPTRSLEGTVKSVKETKYETPEFEPQPKDVIEVQLRLGPHFEFRLRSPVVGSPDPVLTHNIP